MFKDRFKKLIPYIVIVFLFGLYNLATHSDFFFGNPSDASSLILKWGSRGTQVAEAQQKLKDWGYYYGNVDGIYGWKTVMAVKRFQSKNGLPADGMIGNQTGAALGFNVAAWGGAASRSGVTRRDETYTLAQCIHGEARGEPYIGQVAVGAVILNRVNDPRFPNTIAGVIFQPGAFSAVDDGQMFQPPGDSAMRAAQDALNGWDPSGGAVYYYNPAKTTNKWIWSRPVIKVIGSHYFCK